MKFVVSILFVLLGLTGFGQTYYLLAGTYNEPSDSAGIFLYRFNSNTGDVTPVATAPARNASYFVLDHAANHLYIVNELHDDQGAVSSFSFDKKGPSLKFLGTQPSKGDDPCYISVDPSGKWVAAANYSGGNFSVFPVQKDGSLGAAIQTIQHTGKGINADRQEKAHVHSTVFSPDGRFLIVVDLGVDKLFSYPFNAASKTPVGTNAIETPIAPGSGPRHLTFSKDGHRAYVICELSGDVIAFQYHDGKLDSIQTISSHPADFHGEKGSAAIRISPDGKFLYASNRGTSNTISIFSIDPASGKLRSIGFQATGGDHPRDFTIDPSGNFLLVGSMKSGYVSIFKRDQQTGLLKDTGKTIKIPQPTNVLFTSLR